MANQTTFKVNSSTIRGAVVASDGTLMFHKGPVLLENLDVPDQLIEARHWQGNEVCGEIVSRSEWATMVRGGWAINLPSTHPPPQATAWVIRANFPNRALALSEVKPLARCEKRMPGRHGEQVVMVVDGIAGDVVLRKWYERFVRDGLVEFGGGDIAEAKLQFAAALSVKPLDARDVFRFVIADMKTGDAGHDARVSIYANLVRKWGKKNGGNTAIAALFNDVCKEMGVGEVGDLAVRLLGKGG